MAVRFMGAHRQASIEAQDAAVCPRCQETASIGWLFETGVVVLEGFVDVLEGRGSGSGWADGEREAVGLVDIVVGILAQNYRFDSRKRSVAGPVITCKLRQDNGIVFDGRVILP